MLYYYLKAFGKKRIHHFASLKMFCVNLSEVCEEYEELCEYLNENFAISCYGDCGANDAFGSSPYVMEEAWDECGQGQSMTIR